MRGTREAERNVVKLTAALLARVDAWAQANAMNRSDAIQRLIELGLKSETAKPETAEKRVSQQDAIAIEHRTEQQLDQMIDPETPQEERDRRIHRLTEGPPEFVDLRIDLPRRRGKC